MPVITLEVAKLDKDQKAVLAKEITEIAAEVIKLPKETFYVFFREYDLEAIGVGGDLLSDKGKTNPKE